MYYLMFHAVPLSKNPEAASVGGAYVSCWIERATLSEADNVARSWIGSEQWHVDDREEAYSIDRSDYRDDNPSLQYYEQALIDGEVFVFHSYPTPGPSHSI